MADKPVFEDVDSSGIAEELMAYLDDVAALPDMRELRAASYAAMAAAPGQTVLDVGCGLGHALGELADLVGPTGRAIGVDFSAGMAAETARRLPASNVEVSVGDLLHLDLPAASVDGARAERVFQHVNDLAGGCAELARVVRPGGRVVILDTDWTSLRLMGPPTDVAAEAERAWNEVVSPDAILRLPNLLHDAGFSDLTAVATTQVHGDLATAARKMVMLNRHIPVEHWPYSEEFGRRWFELLDEAAAEGRFWSALTLWTVSGRRT